MKTVEKLRIATKRDIVLLRNAPDVRALACLLWEMVIDLQDEVATLAALVEAFEPIPEEVMPSV